MNLFGDILRELVALFCDTAAWLLVGFVIAGLMKVFVPTRWIQGHLGGNDLKSVLRAAIYGVPIPLCSCSVIPTAAGLKEGGASKGATTAFLIATPETGVDSISVTYALLDPIMAVIRPVVAFVTAAVTGVAVNILVRLGLDSPEMSSIETSELEHDHADPDADPCCDAGEGSAAPARGRLRQAIDYAFGPLLDDLTPWLLVGFLISGVIAALTPDDFFTESVPPGIWAMLLMMVVATPIYICATASTPIAAAMIAKGLDPGAALVFLLVGPATNATTLLVVSKLLGKRSLIVYLLGIVTTALAAGVIVNGIYDDIGVDLSAVVAAGLEGEIGWFASLAGIVLLLLMLKSAVRIGLFTRLPKRLIGLVVLLVWGASSVTLVEPGQSGWVMRFGAVAKELPEPGLYLHLPWPLERSELVAPGAIQSVLLGGDAQLGGSGDGPVARPGFGMGAEFDAASEVMAGDGTLIRIAFSVHYSWRDARAVHFGLADPAALVRAFAESSLRRVAAEHDGAALLVEQRDGIAGATHARLQAELDALGAGGSGLVIDSVNLLEVHAPARVHAAYRDVASALEDRERVAHDALRDAAGTLSEARYEAYAELQIASADRDTEVQLAHGEAARFLADQAAHAEYAAIDSLRRQLDGLEAALAGTRTYVLLGTGVVLDLMTTDPERLLGIEALGARPGPTNR